MAVGPDLKIRPAVPTDVPMLFDLIRQLAIYEKLEHAVTGTSAALADHLFGTHPHVEAIVAEHNQQLVGFALFFTSYSTFLTKPGLYLEDIFVLADYRRQGLGKALLQSVAQVAVDRDYGRFEWTVLDWNEPAIAFYQQLGAQVLPDWRICRVVGEALHQLAKGTYGIGSGSISP